MARQLPELDELQGNYASENDLMLIRDESAKQDKRISLKELGKALGLGDALIDLIYPVGSYYETSDADFDPNTAWGGTWVKDTAGRVLVAQDSGTFATLGATGGAESHRHDFMIAMKAFYAGFVGDDWETGVNGTGAWSYKEQTFSKRRLWSGAANTKRNNALANGLTTYSETCRRSWGDTDLESSLQPYKVVVRWHRTA